MLSANEEILYSKENYMKFIALKDEKSLENHRISNLMSNEDCWPNFDVF